MISQLEFECILAHDNHIKVITGFNSIMELYEKIGQNFSLPIDQILFCTLNKIDPRLMDNLLSNYLSKGDRIYVHLVGPSEYLTLSKTQERLGLTITDNGHGRCFVKRVLSNDGHIERLIKPGDHIASIDGRSVIGMRHYEVAQALREIPLTKNFDLEVIRPLVCAKSATDLMDTEEPINNGSKNALEVNQQNPKHEYMSLEDLALSSLPLDKLLSRASISNSSKLESGSSLRSDQDIYRMIIGNINSILESFIGINDDSLAIKIYRLAKDHKKSREEFSKAISESELCIFKFGKQTESHLWSCVNEGLI